MAGFRTEKVAQEILRCLADALLYDVKDPRLTLVSLTNATVSKDLQVARINWLSSSEVAKEDIEKALLKATPLLRKVIADNLSLRRVPNLFFHYDEAFENAARMDAIIHSLRERGEMGSDETTNSDETAESDEEA